jgi:hypothetical protein
MNDGSRLAGNQGDGFAAALPRCAAQGMGPPLRHQGCCASLTRRPFGPALTPETSANPRARERGQAMPAPPGARRKPIITKTEVSTVPGDCQTTMTSKTDTANALDRITHITPIIYLAHAAGLLRQRGSGRAGQRCCVEAALTGLAAKPLPGCGR